MSRLSLATLVTAAAPLAAQAPSGWARYTDEFSRFVETRGVVGGAVAYVRSGRIVAHREYGLADRAKGLPVTEASIFHWGSITKTLTAIAVMQLRDRGRLSLDDRATTWIPELRQVHSPFGPMDAITVRMLLSHSSGFQNPTWPYGRGLPWEPFEPTRWEQLVSMMPYQSLRFAPGSQYGYSNPAFIYLARILEAATGDPYQGYVHKNLWTPLGLDASYFGSTPYHLAASRSHNYTITRDSATKGTRTVDNGADFDPGITIPNGGWNAPLRDLARYMAFLTGDLPEAETAGRAVLERRTLEEMWRPVVTQGLSTDGSAAMGLGFFLFRDGERRLVGHTGQQAGFLSFLFFDPSTREGVIAAINTWDDADSAAFSREFGALGAAARTLLLAR